MRIFSTGGMHLAKPSAKMLFWPIFFTAVMLLRMWSLILYQEASWEKNGQHDLGPKNGACVKPSILLDLSEPQHWEVTFSFIHYFGGGDLPYASAPSPALAALRQRAKHCGADFAITPKYVKGFFNRDRVMLHHMGLYNYSVSIGIPAHVDLRIVLNTSPHLLFFLKSLWSGWHNNPHVLIVLHNFKSWWLDDPCAGRAWSFGLCLSGLKEWGNVYSLSPYSRRYIMPTFFPFSKATFPNTSALQATLCFVSPSRRDVDSLVEALRLCSDCNLKIMMITCEPFPAKLKPFSKFFIFLHTLEDEIIYHHQFQRCTHMLPLLGPRTDPEYLHGKLSSSVAYGIGFGLQFIAHNYVKAAYPMITGHFYKDNVEFASIIREVSRTPITSPPETSLLQSP